MTSHSQFRTKSLSYFFLNKIQRKTFFTRTTPKIFGKSWNINNTFSSNEIFTLSLIINLNRFWLTIRLFWTFAIWCLCFSLVKYFFTNYFLSPTIFSSLYSDIIKNSNYFSFTQIDISDNRHLTSDSSDTGRIAANFQ